MPRLVIESRAVVAPPRRGARARRSHPAPRALTPQAKAVWRAIVTSKPYDGFDPGSLVLLRQYCEIAVQAELLVERRRAMDLQEPGDEPHDSDESQEQEGLERRISSYVAMLTSLATKLRLSVQSSVDRSSRKLDEKGPPAHRLLGGNVTRLGERGA